MSDSVEFSSFPLKMNKLDMTLNALVPTRGGEVFFLLVYLCETLEVKV